MRDDLKIELISIGRYISRIESKGEKIKELNNKMILADVKTVHSKIIAVIEALDNENGSPEKWICRSSLLSYCRILIDVKRKSNNPTARSNFGPDELKIYQFMNSDIDTMANQNENQVTVQEQEKPGLLRRWWENFVAYFTEYFSSPDGEGQNFMQRAWIWITKIIQLPVHLITKSAENSVRFFIKSLFYVLRHPTAIVGATPFDGYDLCLMPDDLKNEQVAIDKIYLCIIDKNKLQYCIRNPQGNINRSSLEEKDLGKENFSALRKAFKNKTFDYALSSYAKYALVNHLASLGHAQKELNTLQYWIKEIEIGFDKHVKNMFGITSVALHPVDTLDGIYRAIKSFLQSENKWDEVKNSFKQRWRDIKHHPLQYTPEVLMIILSVALPFVIPYITGAMSGVAAEGVAVSKAAETLSKVVPSFAPSMLASMPLITPFSTTSALTTPVLTSLSYAMTSHTSASCSIVTNSATNHLNVNAAQNNSSQGPLSIDELKVQVEMLKEDLEFYTDKSHQFLYQEILQQIDQIESEIKSRDPSAILTDHVAVMQSEIAELEDDLKYYDEKEHAKLYAEIKQKIAVLQENILDYQAPKPISVHTPTWIRTPVDSIIGTRDGSFAQRQSVAQESVNPSLQQEIFVASFSVTA